MTQERKNGLALLHVQRDMQLELENVRDMFARKHPRRIERLNVLESDEPSTS